MTEHEGFPTPPQSEPANQQQPQQFQQFQQPQTADQVLQSSWQQPQPANPYAQPPIAPMGTPAPGAQKNGKALGALICGILAIVFSGTIVAGIILGIVAIVLAVLSKRNGKDGKATTGMICGIIGAALSVIMCIAVIAAMSMGLVTSTGNWAINLNNGSSSSAETKTPLADRVKDEVVADDKVCTIKVNKIAIDEKGDLRVYLNVVNRVKTNMYVKSRKYDAWEVNGGKAECDCFIAVETGKTKNDFFTIPASYLDTDDVNDIESIIGTLEVDVETSIPMEYDLLLV